MAMTPASPGTSFGVVAHGTRTDAKPEAQIEGPSAEPSPNWPYSLAPQQRTLPSVLNAQVCLPPAAIATTLPSAATGTGVGEHGDMNGGSVTLNVQDDASGLPSPSAP